MQTIGNFLDMCAQCTVMLEILFIAKGWTITESVLRRRLLVYSIWAIYSVVYVILFAFTIVSHDSVFHFYFFVSTIVLHICECYAHVHIEKFTLTPSHLLERW